jgi:hypothetical protein
MNDDRYLKLQRESAFQSTRRAMREMGFDPGNQLDLPPQSFLDEKGMTQDEFMDAVFDRAREISIAPIRPLAAGRIDSGQPRPQMRGEGERTMAREARGGMGASATEDLLERLSQYKSSAYGNKYQQGGEVKGNGPSIKIPGQYAYEPIATTESGEQYVTMELPDGTMATVFGDWETYGNPSQEGYIEDIDYRIIPRGDGSYELDAGEMESEMLRDESREFSRGVQGGPGASPIQDLLEKLSDRPGMGMTPEGRMRPIKRR